MNQSNLESILEAAVSTATGFAMSWAASVYIAARISVSHRQVRPWAHATVDRSCRSCGSTSWRRFFNAGLHRAIQHAVMRLG